MKVSISKRQADFRPQFLAGDLALDFLNTVMKEGGEVLDVLQTDADVLAWLKKAGFPAFNLAASTAPLTLLRDARYLRESIRLLVEHRKAGRRGDPSVLNRFLRYSQSYPQLVWEKPRSLTIERMRPSDSLESMLAPIAEAAAMLLATEDFDLVKRCESEACILWYYDRTKSHRRRWCSSKICGNRHKVAAYRKRHKDRLATRK